MESNRFDALARGLAGKSDRRTALKGLVGGVAALAGLRAVDSLARTTPTPGGGTANKPATAGKPTSTPKPTTAGKPATTGKDNAKGACNGTGGKCTSNSQCCTGAVCVDGFCCNAANVCTDSSADGFCANFHTVQTCGSCGNTCTTTVVNARPTCSKGTCGFECIDGYVSDGNGGCVAVTPTA